jgi:uncharacterized protein (TIGR03000 family)
MVPRRIRAGRLLPLAVTALLLAAGPGVTWADSEAMPAGRPAEPRPVRITVRVPAHAEVWFDGTRTSQTGPERLFESPPLPHGRDFSYALRVRWTDGGRAVEHQRRLSFRAGDRLTVDYAGPVRAEVRSYYDASGAGAAGTPNDVAPPPVSAPVFRVVPVEIRSNPPANVAPMSEQGGGSGPPGSNYRPSFRPGYG